MLPLICLTGIPKKKRQNPQFGSTNLGELPRHLQLPYVAPRIQHTRTENAPQRSTVIRIREKLSQVIHFQIQTVCDNLSLKTVNTRWKPHLPRFEVRSTLGVFLALTLPQLSLPCLLRELSDVGSHVAMDL